MPVVASVWYIDAAWAICPLSASVPAVFMWRRATYARLEVYWLNATPPTVARTAATNSAFHPLASPESDSRPRKYHPPPPGSRATRYARRHSNGMNRNARHQVAT